MAAFTGMRCSEVLALHWEQLNGDILTIDRAWKSRSELGTPKSGKTRTIPLAPSVLYHLPERDHKLIFCHADGSRLGETWWRKNWNSIVCREREKDGTITYITMADEKITPHSLRHSLNSNLITAGVPLQFIQEYLGWSRTGLAAAQQEYTHITPDDLRVVSAAVDRLYASEGVVLPFTHKNQF
jgi:integrase